MNRAQKDSQIRKFLLVLYSAWGRQHWWPAQSRFEVVVGAILTQNTAWTNVGLALSELRRAGVLSLEGIRETALEKLQKLIRSAGFFRQKALRLKTFVSYLDARYGGSLETMFARPTGELRRELLSLNGIGPETADSILLYAGQHPVFVVDAYARRILGRHEMVPENAKYEEIREFFERALTDPIFVAEFRKLAEKDAQFDHSKPKPPGAHHAPSPMSEIPRSEPVQVFNEMHALIVGVAKNYCQSRRALCQECPLGVFLKKPPKIVH